MIDVTPEILSPRFPVAMDSVAVRLADRLHPARVEVDQSAHHPASTAEIIFQPGSVMVQRGEDHAEIGFDMRRAQQVPLLHVRPDISFAFVRCADPIAVIPEHPPVIGAAEAALVADIGMTQAGSAMAAEIGEDMYLALGIARDDDLIAPDTPLNEISAVGYL
jgi:hypothetical protein